MATKMGRPTVMTDSLVNKLEQAFMMGASDSEACCYVGISKKTLYNYCEKVPEFLHRKEGLKAMLTMKAKFIIHQSLLDGNLATANKVLDRGARLEGRRLVYNKPTPVSFEMIFTEPKDNKVALLQ